MPNQMKSLAPPALEAMLKQSLATAASVPRNEVAPQPVAREMPVINQPIAVAADTTTPSGQTFTVAEIGQRIRSRSPEAFSSFTDEQIVNRAIERKPELRSLIKTDEAPKKNFAQEILSPITDTLATGYRTVQSVPGLVKGLGQIALGDKVAGEQTILEAGKDVEKPVNIPFLGQGEIRKLGTVDDKGFINLSDETVKTIGTGLEVGSFATPIKAPVGSTLTKAGGAVFKATGKPLVARAAGVASKYGVPSAMTGFAAGTGQGLAEGKSIGESLAQGAAAAPVAGIIGSAIPMVAGSLSKKIVNKQTQKAANQMKAEQIYRQALGLSKGEAKKEAISALKAQRFGTDVRNLPKDLLEEGIELKAVEDAGRRVFSTTDNVAQITSKIDDLEKGLDEIIATRPQKQFNLNILRARAKLGINRLEGVTALEKKKMVDKIDDIIQAELVANGYKAGDKASMARSAFIHGVKAQELKKGLYKMADYERKQMGNDQYAKVLASVIREEIEKQYANVADIAAINKRIGKLVGMSDFLTSIHGGVVKGGMLGRKISGLAGTVAGQGIPVPILGPMLGYMGAERLADVIGDPGRLSRKALRLMQPKKAKIIPPMVKKAADVAESALKRTVIIGSSKEKPAD